MKTRFAIIACVAWFVCGQAAAQTMLEGLDARQCNPRLAEEHTQDAGERYGTVSHSDFLINLRQSYRIAPDPPPSNNQPPPPLGARAAAAAASDCAGAACSLEVARLRKLFSDTQAFAQTSPHREGNFRRSGQRFPAEELSQRAIEVLNGDASWYEIECLVPAPEAGDAGGGFIIGRSSEDLSRQDLGDREFATLSITEDRSAENETAAIEFFVGLPLENAWLDGRRIGERGELESAITPYFSIHKTDVEQDEPAEGEVDDVTFGLASVNYLLRDGFLTDAVTFSLEWETDVSFESSMTTARIMWEPLINRMDTCLISPNRFPVHQQGPPIRCSATLVADYADVGDPGEKISLEDVNQYTRVGFNFEFDYDFRLDNGNVVNLGLGYAIREPVADDEGDADLISAELLFLPSPESHFSFGVEYRHGEDLSSLEEQETTLARVGFRY